MKTLKISNCWNCPFVNEDNVNGYDRCNLDTYIEPTYEMMPKDEVHKDCPLKKNEYLIKL